MSPAQHADPFADVRRLMLVQRAILTVVIAALVVVLPMGPNRFLLAGTIVVVQIVSTWAVQRRRPEPIDELGAFMMFEHGLIALAGVMCPPAYVAGIMMAIASLGINAPYLTLPWLRRIAPVTVLAAVLPPMFREVSSAPSVIAITVVLSVHMSVNRSGAVLLAEDAASHARWQADHDALTGLANRRVLINELDALSDDVELGLLLIDLNDFKEINDTFGHEVGDAALRSVASQLAACDESVLALRLGGDEFAVMIPGPARETERIADLIVARMGAAITVGDHEIEMGVSIGLAHSSSAEPHELLRFADLAMFDAKRNGGGRAWYCSKADAPRPQGRRQRRDRPLETNTAP